MGPQRTVCFFILISWVEGDILQSLAASQIANISESTTGPKRKALVGFNTHKTKFRIEWAKTFDEKFDFYWVVSVVIRISFLSTENLTLHRKSFSAWFDNDHSVYLILPVQFLRGIFRRDTYKIWTIPGPMDHGMIRAITYGENLFDWQLQNL